MAKATEGTELKRLVSLIRHTENLHAEQVNKMEGTPIRVEPLSPKQAAPAGDLLAASHADYPSFRHLFPDAATRGRVLRRFMTAVARDAAAHGQALVAHDKSGFLGVALWMPPGSYPLSFRRKLQMTPALLGVAVIAGSAFLAFARVGTTLEQAHPADHAWYLQALGVHPRVQRRGIGRLLLAPVLALADEAGLACHLHTADPANISYYRRFGFEIVQPALQVFPKGPSYIGMARPAPDRLGGVPVASTHRADQRDRISPPGAKV
jgi:ribosomal protein S18 acetylase RimI-like enzyme